MAAALSSTFHVLVLGEGAPFVCAHFDELSNGRVRTVAVEPSTITADGDAFHALRVARVLAERKLADRVDMVLVLWEETVSRDTASLVFSLTESFRTCKERVFLCAREPVLPAAGANNLPLDARFEIQSSLLFFSNRTLLLDSPIGVLKTLLRARPAGPALRFSEEMSEENIASAIERRDARREMYAEAAKDERARASLERRFHSKLDASRFPQPPQRVLA